MKNKSFLSRLKPSSEKKAIDPEVELKMLPRLKAVAYAFLLCGLFSFSYALIPYEAEALGSAESPLQVELYAGLGIESEEPLAELHPKAVLNFYVVSAIFTCIGGAVLFLARYKRKRLSSLIYK